MERPEGPERKQCIRKVNYYWYVVRYLKKESVTFFGKYTAIED